MTGTGSVYKRGNVWWVRYHHRGKRYQESSRSRRKGDAVALLRKRMGEMGSGKVVGPTEEKLTFEDLTAMIERDYAVVKKNRSTKRLRTSLNHLAGFFGLSRALDITTDRVTAYIEHRDAEGAAPASIQKELAALKRAFKLAVQAGRVRNAPHVPSVKVSNTRKGFVNAAELDRIAAELPDDLRPVARFGFFTGWRKGEILGLQWAAVDFEAGTARLTPDETKNEQGREFPFRALPPLAALLEEQRERTRAFEREHGEIITHVFHRGGRPIRDMNGAWRAACERAGLAGTLFHDLRRSAVRNLERAGLARSTAMQLTGHKTESVYRRYAIGDSVSREEGVRKLAAFYETGQEARKVVPIREADTA